MTAEAAVADAGPLIHLHEAGVPHVLGVFGSLSVPPEVWRETVGRARVPERALLDVGVHRAALHGALDEFIASHNLGALHQGEQECLCLCLEAHIAVVLTDDLAAREAARRLGLTPVGSLGVVARAFRAGKLSLDDAEESLYRLHKASSLFVTHAIVDLALEQLRRNK